MKVRGQCMGSMSCMIDTLMLFLSFFLSFFLIDPPLIYVSTTCIFYMLAWLWLGYVYLLSPFSKFIGHHLHWIVFNIKDWVHYPIFAWSLSESPSPLCPFFLAGCVKGLKPNFPVAPDSNFFFTLNKLWYGSQVNSDHLGMWGGFWFLHREENMSLV